MSYFAIFVFLKKNYKSTAFILVSLAAIYFYLHSRSEKKRADNAERGRDAAIIISNKFENQSHFFKNKFGDQVIVTRAIEVDRENIKAIARANDLRWLEKFEGLKKNKSNLQSATTFSTELKPKVIHHTIYLPCRDSVKVFEYNLHDKWNDISARVIDTPRFMVRDSIFCVIETRRPKGWFLRFQWSKKEIIGEITNSNKNIQIKSAAVFSIR